MEFRLLGPVEVTVRGSVIQLGPPRHRFVLAVLALEANRMVPLSRLVELSWPDSPPRSAVHAIQVAVSRLRSVLAAAGSEDCQVGLLTHGMGYLLKVDPARIDAHRFRALVREARDTRDDERRVALLRDGLALWRGPVRPAPARLRPARNYAVALKRRGWRQSRTRSTPACGSAATVTCWMS